MCAGEIGEFMSNVNSDSTKQKLQRKTERIQKKKQPNSNISKKK